MKDKTCLCGKVVDETIRRVGQEPIYCSTACARRDAYSALTARETLKNYGISVQEPAVDHGQGTSGADCNLPEEDIRRLQNIFAHVSHYRRCCKEEKYAKRLWRAEAKARAKATKLAESAPLGAERQESERAFVSAETLSDQAPRRTLVSLHGRNDSDVSTTSTMTSASTATDSSIVTPSPSSPGAMRPVVGKGTSDYFGQTVYHVDDIASSAKHLSEEHLYWTNAATEGSIAGQMVSDDIEHLSSSVGNIQLDQALTDHIKWQDDRSSRGCFGTSGRYPCRY